MKKIINYIREPKRIILFLAGKSLLNWLPDKPYLRLRYWAKMGERLHLDDPQTFNEKLQWLKLNDRKPEYTLMVDKYEVKRYVADIIGEEYVIPTLGVWNSFDEINFENLPQQFVLKCTHDSGGIVICKDKNSLDVSSAKKIINNSLCKNFFEIGREWPYKDVKPRIIAEKYIGENILDYKFLCFNGRVKCSFVCSERFSHEGLHVTFYDLNWNRLPFSRHYPVSEYDFIKPKQYEKMLEFSEMLSVNIPFVRCDFYEINGQLFFSELTFFPGSGMEEFTPEKWDYVLGSWITLPCSEVDGK